MSVHYPDVAVLPASFTGPDFDMETIFGPIVTGGDVEDWVFAVLQKWSCTYVAEVARQHDAPAASMPHVKGWVPAPTFEKWPEDQVPAVSVVCTGAADPLRVGDGGHRVNWAVSVGVLCHGRTQAISRRLAHWYLAAHTAILLQRPSLEGHAAGVRWLGADFRILDYNDTRSLYSGEALFTVTVDGNVYGNAGPVTPDDPQAECTDPWEPWGEFETVHIDVNDDVDAVVRPLP